MKTLKYFDSFTGYGGFSLGIERVVKNAECIGFSEIDKFAIQVYKKHFPKHYNYGDITKIQWNKISDFDLLTGGSPCQDFSIAGKRKGIEGDRSGLIWEFIRALREKKPKYFIWENVKGVMSSRNGFDFASILIAFSESGYSLQWEVLNAKNFGVPQNRERLFVVGYSGKGSGQQIFPIGENDKETSALSGQQTNTITARYEGAQATGSYIIESKLNAQKIKQINKPSHSNDRVYSDKGISPTLNIMQGGRRQPFVASVLTPDRKNKRQNGRRIKENGEPSFTLTGQDKHGIYDGSEIRRLTPLECERLMGLPDLFTELGINEKGDIVKLFDSARYKLCGNGVVVNCVEEIIKRLYN